MFKNYVLLALRQLRRNRGYSFINIFGLATGMAIALVIGIWAVDELSVDQHIPNGDRVVEIMQNQWPKGQASEKTPPLYVGTTVSAALNPWLQKGNYQDIFEQTAMALWGGQHLLVNGDKSIAQNGTRSGDNRGSCSRTIAKMDPRAAGDHATARSMAAANDRPRSRSPSTRRIRATSSLP